MVMKMRVFVLKKVHIVINIVVLIIIISTFYCIFHKKESLAIELDNNSIMKEDFKERIEELTKGEEKIAYLTFDDGPNKLVTPKVLEILKEEKVKATFFVIGKNVEEHPEIVKKEYEEGHYIGNHGYSHNNYELYKSEGSFIKELKKTDEAIGKAIGEEDYCSHIFRFPNGYMSLQNKGKKKIAAKILEEMDYTYIDWNCLNNDSVKKYTKEQLLQNLKKSVKNKNTLVILMHDTKDVSNSSLILKESIEYLKEEGYEFKNFYDLMEEN